MTTDVSFDTKLFPPCTNLWVVRDFPQTAPRWLAHGVLQCLQALHHAEDHQHHQQEDYQDQKNQQTVIQTGPDAVLHPAQPPCYWREDAIHMEDRARWNRECWQIWQSTIFSSQLLKWCWLSNFGTPREIFQ